MQLKILYFDTRILQFHISFWWLWSTYISATFRDWKRWVNGKRLIPPSWTRAMQCNLKVNQVTLLHCTSNIPLFLSILGFQSHPRINTLTHPHCFSSGHTEDGGWVGLGGFTPLLLWKHILIHVPHARRHTAAAQGVKKRGRNRDIERKKKQTDRESGWDHLLQPSVISPTLSIPTLWFMPQIISTLYAARIQMSMLPYRLILVKDDFFIFKCSFI